MQLIRLLTDRFANSLQGVIEPVDQYAGMIRGTNDPKHGDYQFNGAMSIAKKASLGAPRDAAQRICDAVELSDICSMVEVAGPGFINLQLRDDFIAKEICKMATDPAMAIDQIETPQTVLIDFSSPNVAKPLHVGHIRSTVIGDSLARLYRRRGFKVVTDNHLGDWGTQFGIIIYGYKHFGDPAALQSDPIGHLSGIYRQIQSLIEYHKSIGQVPETTAAIEQANADLAILLEQEKSLPVDDAKAKKKHRKSVDNARRRIRGLEITLDGFNEKIAAVKNDSQKNALAEKHAAVAEAVLIETAKLHQGDPENGELWERFLPFCLDEIQRIYDRLSVKFDHTLGESFYHPMLNDVVEKLIADKRAVQSDGAICVFLDGYDAPMIIRKRDGAFLYATTDLATLTYRQETFDPSKILYVVDSRQSEHFEKLFAASTHIGIDDIELEHVHFGTVLGKDGKPMKTRSGSLIGLESLLDAAVQRAAAVVCDPERLARFDPPMDPSEQQQVAEAVGIGAIKFADLSHHRTSDYRFDIEKMVALEGNTATYIQYQYARTQSILRRVGFDPAAVGGIAVADQIQWTEPAERALALQLLRLDDSITSAIQDNAPNHLADYAIEVARQYARFNDSCSVIGAENDAIANTRILLVFTTGRLLAETMSLLGIESVDRM